MLYVLGVHPDFVCNASEKMGVNKKSVKQKNDILIRSKGVGIIERSQPKGVNSKMRGPKLKVGVNW